MIQPSLFDNSDLEADERLAEIEIILAARVLSTTQPVFLQLHKPVETVRVKEPIL